jgi:hypothetical protein
MQGIAACSVFPISDSCPSCQGEWSKVPHQTYHRLNTYYCLQCRDICDHYKLRIYHDRTSKEFRYDVHGRPLKTIEQAMEANIQIRKALADGTFKKSNYEKVEDRSMFLHLAESSIKGKRLSEEESEFLEEYMAPFLADVGIFTVSEVHLMDFIDTFRLRGDRKEMAERVFNKVLTQIAI